jgi:hypothetical protein
VFHCFVEQTEHVMFSVGSDICVSSVVECCCCQLFMNILTLLYMKWTGFREHKISGTLQTARRMLQIYDVC